MKRRVLHPYKILAVALASIPACSKQSDTVTTDPAHTTPSSSASAAMATPPPTTSASASPTQATESPALVALREELATAGHDKAFAAKTHYRPLCDAQGYPLVGNLARKAPDY